MKTNSSIHYVVMKQTKPTLDDIRKFKIQCQYCNTGPSELSKWTFVQKRWYEKPFGCMDGDCWHNTEVRLCDIKCPYCKRSNYIHNHKQKAEIMRILDAIGIFSLDTLFKEVTTKDE